MTHGRLISVCSALLFLGIWTALTAFQFGHQFGHIVSGCSHHSHHDVHAHRHALCTIWEGSHEDTQISEHFHVCEVCGWDWVPESPQPTIENVCTWTVCAALRQAWSVLETSVLPHDRLTEPDRGPPLGC